jgi:hypothetical protein
MNVNFNSIKVNEDYRKKWNLYCNDFVVIATKDGELISNTLYRKGGMWDNPTTDTKYVLIIKHVENKRTKQLDYFRCIVDENGNEKVVFKPSLDYPYLIEKTCLYTLKGCIFHIETNTLITKEDSVMHSDEFLFVENKYDDDKNKRGVWKICKKTGNVLEFFKNSK